jgi:hypothetical protein
VGETDAGSIIRFAAYHGVRQHQNHTLNSFCPNLDTATSNLPESENQSNPIKNPNDEKKDRRRRTAARENVRKQ